MGCALEQEHRSSEQRREMFFMTENLTKQLRIVTKAQVSYVLSDSTHFRQQWFPSRPQGIFTGSQLFM